MTDSPQGSKLKNVLEVLGSIAAFVFVLIAMALGKMFGEGAGRQLTGRTSDNAPQETTEQMLERVAVAVNSKLPSMLDSETRLEKVTAGPGKAFTYHYRLVNYRLGEIDARVLDPVWPKVKTNYCQGAEMRPYKEQGVTVRYVYNGSDGGYITSFMLVPAHCDDINSYRAPSVSQEVEKPPLSITIINPSTSTRSQQNYTRQNHAQGSFSNPRPKRCVYKSVMTDEEIARCKEAAR